MLEKKIPCTPPWDQVKCKEHTDLLQEEEFLGIADFITRILPSNDRLADP